MTPDVKEALRGRHPGGVNGSMPGPWTVLEEWRGIDVLAVSAWSSAGGFARVGYEVKVSRADLRRELLRPSKRARNVAWCNEFYFAMPRGLLTTVELYFEEPDWEPSDYARVRCPGYGRGRRARQYRFDESPHVCWRLRGKRRYLVDVPVPHVGRPIDGLGGWTSIPCPTCNGTGYVEASVVEKEAPTCWVPRDVGLIVVDGNGCHVLKPSPRRKDVPPLEPRELGQLVRWVSMRPDSRHHAAARERVA